MFVFSNLATSIDGKIATQSREYFPLGTAEDRRMMEVLRVRSDIVVMGASTLRTFRKFCGVPGRERQPANAIVSRALEGVSPEWPFFKNRSLKRILFHTQAIPTKRRQAFEKSSTLVRLDTGTRAAPVSVQILEHLAELGFKRVLVEGGGELMWDFASQNRIDEYFVTLTPRILGGSQAPTLVDGPGFRPKDVLNLKLVKCRKVKDELFLTYRPVKPTGHSG
jgi:riboflavin-specific deaminase-like protein